MPPYYVLEVDPRAITVAPTGQSSRGEFLAGLVVLLV
jgi:hypothetical protein